MSASRETLHLLLLTESQNDAESIISLLRNSGSATRAHPIASIADFVQQLQEKNWDLVIAQPNITDIDYSELLRQIQRLNKDLPVILITRDEVDPMSMEAALKHGAATLAPLEESSLLLRVIQRELKHLNERRAKRTLEVKLRDAEKRCQGLLESSKDAVAYIHDGMHIYANQAYLDLFGYRSADDLEGMPIMDMIAAPAQAEFKTFLKHYGKEGQAATEHNTIIVNGQGESSPLTMVFSNASYAEERCTQVVIRNRQDQSELEAQLAAIQSRDLLTGLYNKPYFTERLEHAVDRAILNNAKGAVLYLNLDAFDKIKSQIGIAHADTVISEIAHCLQRTLSDQQQLARVGEDIFCALLMDCDDKQAQLIAEKIRKHIETLLIEVGQRTFTITASIGLALITDSCSNPMDILLQAQQASDKVRKLEGHERGNGINLFMPVIESEETQDAVAGLQQQLIDAVRHNRFRLLFQPLINLRGEDTEHYETLLRLPQANGDDLSAGDFFSHAELSDDLKRKIDRWVILHTTKLLGEHRMHGNNTRVFINLAAASLSDETLPGWISVAINAAKLPKGSVIFQFNEEDAGRMLKQCQQFTHALLERGIPTAISRFGCALKPFQTLKHLDIDYVKVDGSFTRELGQNPDAQKHLKALLQQLHEDEKITIVPLVENASEVSSLWQMGAHFIQGYYVQAPQAGMVFDFADEPE